MQECVVVQAVSKAAQQAGQLDEQVTNLQAQQMQTLQFNEVSFRTCCRPSTGLSQLNNNKGQGFL